MFCRQKKRQTEGDRLFTLNFVLLFFLGLFSNCYLSVYYCFEQWLEHLSVAPTWRGLLLGVLFGTVMFTRPVASIVLLRFNKLPAVVISLLVCSGVLFSYQFLDTASPWFEWTLFGMRAAQGFFLAIFSACTVSLLVECIPAGQSARGFALFSLTGLLPYALLPSIGELVLPLVGDEPGLFAWTSFLLVPCLVMTFLLASKFKKPEVTGKEAASFALFARQIVFGVAHSGLGLVFLALMTFSLTTQTCIFFMKGLCSLTGNDPGSFFACYCCTIMAVRILGSSRLDTLPRYRIVPVFAGLLAASLVLITYAPASWYIPATILYGAGISLMYPLMASVVYNRSTPQTRPVNSNLMMMMFDSAGLISPLVGGAILNLGFGYRAVIMAAAAMAVLSGTFFALDRIRMVHNVRKARAARKRKDSRAA